MPDFPRKKNLIKTIVVFCVAIIAIFGFQKFSNKYVKVSASAFGPTPARTGAPGETNCTACHTGNAVNSGTGGVTITGLPANYLPNQQIPVTVTTRQEDAVIYGFQLTAVDGQGKKVGNFTVPTQSPMQTQLANGVVNGNQRTYVEHTVDGLTPTVFGTKSWTFTWTAPAQRVGKVGFYAAGNAANSDGGTSGDFIYTTSKSTLTGTAISNFDTDEKSDVAVFRPTGGFWFSLNSTNGNLQSAQFGSSTDVPVAADYDGDGKTDLAVWRPSNGIWYIQRSTGGIVGIQLGSTGDIPVVGDYDGDLKADAAVYRPSNGTWYIIRSSNSALVVNQFGISTDKTVQGDYDADGKTDIAVYRASQGVWFVNGSRDGFLAYQFGAANDKPVPADFDGDGKTDVAVFRPSDGGWYLLRSRDGFYAVQFGASTDKPAPADFDGDGKADITVFRNNAWYILKSSDGSFYGVNFGTTGDIPVPSGYIAP